MVFGIMALNYKSRNEEADTVIAPLVRVRKSSPKARHSSEFSKENKDRTAELTPARTARIDWIRAKARFRTCVLGSWRTKEPGREEGAIDEAYWIRRPFLLSRR
jgi:hypothetical protein